MVPANSCCHEEGGDHLPLFWTITATNKTAKIRHFMVLFLLLLSLVISWLISSNNFFAITHTQHEQFPPKITSGDDDAGDEVEDVEEGVDGF